MKVLVVDDEPLARRRLIRMLEKIEGLTVAGEAGDGVEAREKIRELSPDLVFLDIRMPAVDGLTLAAEGHLPPFVFTTAYQEHALRAFELSAVDYLLKPIEQARLEAAVERARRAAERWSPRAVEALIERALGKAPPAAPLRLAAKSGGAVYFFEPQEIARLSASDKYTSLVHRQKEHLLDESLNTLEERLAPHGFLRVHRAELINLAMVRALHVEDGIAEVELTDGQRAPVSRRSLGVLRDRLGLDR